MFSYDRIKEKLSFWKLFNKSFHVFAIIQLDWVHFDELHIVTVQEWSSKPDTHISMKCLNCKMKTWKNFLRYGRNTAVKWRSELDTVT